MATEDGRVTLADYKLILTRNGTARREDVGIRGRVAEALKQYFEVVL